MSANEWRSVPHNVEPRNESRLLIEVDVHPVSGIAEFGQNIPHGKSQLLIYQSQVKQLEKLTQTAEQKSDWESAKRAFERALKKHVEPIKDPQARRAAEASYGQSPSSFYEDMRPGEGGLPPIVSYRVVTSDIPAPETPANLQANQMQALAEAMRAAFAQSAQANARR
jgi:hypothetical protein